MNQNDEDTDDWKMRGYMIIVPLVLLMFTYITFSPLLSTAEKQLAVETKLILQNAHQSSPFSGGRKLTYVYVSFDLGDMDPKKSGKEQFQKIIEKSGWLYIDENVQATNDGKEVFVNYKKKSGTLEMEYNLETGNCNVRIEWR